MVNWKLTLTMSKRAKQITDIKLFYHYPTIIIRNQQLVNEKKPTTGIKRKNTVINVAILGSLSFNCANATQDGRFSWLPSFSLRFATAVFGRDQVGESAKANDRRDEHGGILPDGVERMPGADHNGHHGRRSHDLERLRAWCEKIVPADHFHDSDTAVLVETYSFYVTLIKKNCQRIAAKMW